MMTEYLTWQSELATQKFAERLAQKSLLRSANIQLSGDLGSGKSTFTRYLLRELGVTGIIKSPTYAVVEEYRVVNSSTEQKIWHFDFYRFNDPSEWEDAGFKDIFASEGLKISEWSEKAVGYLPTPDLHINFQIQDNDQRQVTVNAFSEKGRLLLE
jgi:tRNA threonylcarbamoyladenosine biosynthesis protein TsaE